MSMSLRRQASLFSLANGNLSQVSASPATRISPGDSGNSPVRTLNSLDQLQASKLDEPIDVWHEMRLKAMRREFDIFIDALTTDITEQACQQHLQALDDMGEQFMLYEKVVLARQGELTAEDIGMHPEELEAFEEPKKPHPSEYFQDVIQSGTEIKKKLLQQITILFEEDYADRAIMLFKEGLLKQLTSWKSSIIEQLKPHYEDFSEVEMILNNYINPKLEAVQNAQATEKGLEQINNTCLIPLGFQCLLQPPQGEVCKLLNLEPQIFAPCTPFITHVRNYLAKSGKHGLQESHLAILVKKGAIFDSQGQLTVGECPAVIDTNLLQIEQLVKLPARKPKSSNAQIQKPAYQIPIIPQNSTLNKIENEDDVEEIFEEDLPRYLREVELPTTARRDIWSWLFANALERAVNWFEAIEKLPNLVERAANYATREWEEFLL